MIALTSKHERDYLKKIAKTLVRYCNEDMEKFGKSADSYFAIKNRIATSSIRRIAKALLKCLRKY